MPGYVERFEQLVEKLEATPGIRILGFRVNPPAAPDELQRLAQTWHASPAELAFWAETDGMTLVWRFDDREELTSGSTVGFGYGTLDGAATGIIDIMPVARILGQTEFDEDTGLYRLDNHQPDACAAVRVSRAKGPAVVFFDDEPHPLNVGIAGYLELLFLTAGLAYWFRALTEGSWYDARLRKTLFPHLKIADLRSVVKAAKARQ